MKEWPLVCVFICGSLGLVGMYVHAIVKMLAGMCACETEDTCRCVLVSECLSWIKWIMSCFVWFQNENCNFFQNTNYYGDKFAIWEKLKWCRGIKFASKIVFFYYHLLYCFKVYSHFCMTSILCACLCLLMFFCLYFCLTRRTLITSDWHCDYKCYLKEVLLTDLLFLSVYNKAMKYFFLILSHFLIRAENRSVTTLNKFPVSQFNWELNNLLNFFFFSKPWFGHCNWCSAILLRLISQQLRWCWVWQLARRRRARANQLRLLGGTKRCDAGA